MNPIVRRFVTFPSAPVSLLGVLISAACLCAQPTLQITSPPDGTVVAPGQTLSIAVTASGSFNRVGLVAHDPIGFSQFLSAPPYQFTLVIPANIQPDSYA